MVRKTLTALLFAVFWGGLAAAQSALPALYDVTGVASNDVLNVRAAPSGSAPIIGALSYRQLNVEVVRLNDSGRWGLVNMGEQSGWTSMSYLARVPGQPDGKMPRPLRCFGTEPFWSADLERKNFGLSTPDDTLSFDLLSVQTAQGSLSHYSFIATEILREVHGVVRRTACNDGMSDRDFGLGVDLILLRGSNATHLTGCCSVSLQ